MVSNRFNVGEIDLKNIIYIKEENNDNWLINEYLYEQFKDHIIPIVKSYNYVCMLDHYSKYDEKSMSKSIKNIIVDFFNALQRFLKFARDVKSTLNEYIHMPQYYANNFIISTIYILSMIYVLIETYHTTKHSYLTN